MERYEKYKDSGVEWIGEVPAGWETKKLIRTVKKMTNGYVGPTRDIMKPDGIPYIQGIHIKGNTIRFTPDGNYYVSKEWSDAHEKSILKTDDLLVVQTGSIGEVAIVSPEFEGSNCHALLIMRVDKSILHPKYCLYLLASAYGCASLQQIKTGEILFHINGSKLKGIEVLSPPLIEQYSIANYLDRKTAEIDELIAQKERLVKLYEEEKTAIINQAVTKGIDPDAKLKDSGVEWLGGIPEGWEVRKLKYLGDIKYGLGQPPKQKLDGLPLIRATNVFRGRIDDKDMLYVDPDDIPYVRDPVLKENDIIVVRSGAYTADSAIIPKKYEGAITGYDMVFRTSGMNNPLFISYSLLSNYVLKSQLLLHSLRAAQPHLNREELGETLIAMPKNEEDQTSIVNHINIEAARINTKIAKTKKIIDLQKEYRTALISEVVTGKIKVTEETTP